MQPSPPQHSHLGNSSLVLHGVVKAWGHERRCKQLDGVQMTLNPVLSHRTNGSLAQHRHNAARPRGLLPASTQPRGVEHFGGCGGGGGLWTRLHQHTHYFAPLRVMVPSESTHCPLRAAIETTGQNTYQYVSTGPATPLIRVDTTFHNPAPFRRAPPNGWVCAQ